MAPEIALKGLENLPRDYLVLDPMSGSGMVLGTAAKLGLSAIGYDLDPLACMISRTNGNFVNEAKVRAACEKLLARCQSLRRSKVNLPWIDSDDETRCFIDYWFAPMQQDQLRILSYLLIEEPIVKDSKVLDVLKTVVSRLIVTKEPKASLARDTAHSRPHRTILENDFDVWDAIPHSFNHVLAALEPSKLKTNVKTYRGDARRMGRIRDASVDCIVTSPPYLNAIDYMRGHRLSLVWLGHSIPELRKVRSRSIGAEIVDNGRNDSSLQKFLSGLNAEVDERKRRMLRKYYRDLCELTNEAYRVLKPGRKATYVIGNSRINGHEVANSDLLIAAAKGSGFRVHQRYTREIPENKRYMPMTRGTQSNLARRMRSEHVLVLKKAA
jgi:DNA modification methylase